MRFCLARCIGSYFYGQIVIQTQCTIVLVIETEGDNRCAIILVYAHKGWIDGIAFYPRLAFRTEDTHRICTMREPFTTAKHIVRIYGYTLGITVAYHCFTEFLPFSVVVHFHGRKYGWCVIGKFIKLSDVLGGSTYGKNSVTCVVQCHRLLHGDVHGYYCNGFLLSISVSICSLHKETLARRSAEIASKVKFKLVVCGTCRTYDIHVLAK